VGAMSIPVPPEDREAVARAYASALDAYLSGEGEAALARAYELGRGAALQGIGVLEMAMMHHEALVHIVSKYPQQPAIIRQAAQFFAEGLAPFEMTLRADVALRHAKAAADAANLELESFSYSVAHDLRAPLRGIDGFSYMLLEHYTGRLDDRGRKYLGHIRESVKRMGQLIDDLLALSRVTRADLRRTRVDLSDLARTVVRQLQAADNRAVECLFQPNVWAVGDARLLHTALENLLGNAWKFTRRSADARIEFGAETTSRPTVYFVRDNGAGFDMAYAAKLFGVFQRLHSFEEFEGTGIGLATVQRIVKRHGGRIWAEGAVDRGASFYFTLEEGESD
jgi:light-regulated signal transduction histidine kinase (bacteriophytochrome)